MFTSESYGEGDVIGVGINTLKGEVFFTKNGSLCKLVREQNSGYAYKLSKLNGFYPSVCTDTGSTIFSLNFGQKKFEFGLEKHVITEANKFFESINKIEVSKESIYDIVSNYLFLNGSHDTLTELEKGLKLGRSEHILLLQKKLKEEADNYTQKRLTQRLNSLPSDINCPPSHATAREGSLTAVTRSIFGNFGSSIKKFFKKESNKKECDKIWEELMRHNQPSEKLMDETGFAERSQIRLEIIKNNIEEAQKLFKAIFKNSNNHNRGIIAIFKVLEFLKIHKEGNLAKSLNYAKENLNGDIKNQKIKYIDKEMKIETFEVRVDPLS